ncbi:MAG: lipocalin-like domain-containing protein [Betaproteobacteria bacterium]
MPSNSSIVGTWRLRTFEVWTPEGKVTTPLGSAPIGYAIFDDSGRAFIQISQAPDATVKASAETQAAQAASFLAYFGVYTVNALDSTLSIKVEGSNLAAYVGSTQARSFTVNEGTLTMGQPGKYRAVAVRV